MNIELPTQINVSFPVRGGKLPADHAFSLYSAIAHFQPDLHSAENVAIEMISGYRFENGLIALPDDGASLRMRFPVDNFGKLLPLAGKQLVISGYKIRLGIPVARPVLPSANLYARIVTIKNHIEPETFLIAANQKLLELNVKANLEFPPEPMRNRRIVTIHGKKVVGFSLAAKGLSDEDSMKLQTFGLGGRRKMGCGIFNPIINNI